jgi:Polyketide cyclase / dehydrase and lipid transport
MATWTEQTTVRGRPEDVLAVLTDPDACGRWSPIDFDVHGLEGERLEAGTRACVSGRLGGRAVDFDVHVRVADATGLELDAHGPVALGVRYSLRPVAEGSEVCASISVEGSGFVGRLLAQATDALLAGGALRHAVARIAREVEADLQLAA